MPAAQDRDVVEKFVKLVRSNPVLYDTSAPDRRYGQLLHNTWANIAKAMGNTNMNGDGWKKKWTSLRDTYIRRKKESLKRDKAASNKKQWVFFNIMSFLDDFIELKSTENNIHDHSYQQNEESETDVLESPLDGERSCFVCNCTQQSGKKRRRDSDSSVTCASCSQENSHILNIIPLKRQTEEVSSVDPDIKELILDIKRSHFAAETDPEGDKAFFESCSRRMKKLSAQTRSFLKLQISQLFFNAENPTLPPLGITPLLPESDFQSSSFTSTYSAVQNHHDTITKNNEHKSHLT